MLDKKYEETLLTLCAKKKLLCISKHIVNEHGIKTRYECPNLKECLRKLKREILKKESKKTV